MQPTAFGLVLLPLCLLFLGQPLRLLQLVLVAAVFEAAAALLIGGKFGLQPAMVPGLLFLAHISLQYALGMRYPGEAVVLRALVPLLAFAAWSIGATFVVTDLFAGTPVWPLKHDLGYGIMVPLGYGMGNVTQGLYLLLNVSVTVGAALYLTRAGIPFRPLIAAYLASGYLVVFLGAWQLAARLGGFWWPADFLYSNEGWTIVEQSIGGIPRIQGPFTEPSSMGSYLSGVTFCCLWLCIRGHEVMRPRLLLTLSLVGVALSTSTSGIVALAVGMPLLLGYAVATGGGAGIHRITTTLAMVAAVGLVVLGPLFVLKPELMDSVASIVDATLDKKESQSYEDRSQADADALQAAVSTYGLGVGWGSTRSSSLIAGLLANSGVVGVLLVLWFVVRLSRFKSGSSANAPKGHPALAAMDGFAAALSGVMVPALLAAPTITSMAFFIQVACLVGAAARVRVEAQPAGTGALGVRARTPAFWLGAAESGGAAPGGGRPNAVAAAAPR